MSQRTQSAKRFVTTHSTLSRQRITAAAANVEGLECRRLMAIVPARPAEDFVDSIGVNTHFNLPGTSNPYTKQISIDLVKSLGVRHIRSGDHTTNAHTRLEGLYNTAGVQTLIVPPADTATASPTYMAGRMSNAYAEALEGLNEPANWLHNWNGYTSVDTYDDGGTQRTLGDFTAVRQYNDEMYALSKQTAPAKPVLSSAMGNPQMNPYLAGTQFDIQAMHPYPGTGAMADFWKYDNFDIPAREYTGGTKPIWNTETGYFTANSVTGNVTEAAQGKFVPRMLAEFYKRGVDRTYLYELIDEGSYNGGAYSGDENGRKETSYGLTRVDGTPKPAFNALKNLISVVNEYPTWNATTQSFNINPNNPDGSLDFTLADDPSDTTLPADVSDVRHLLLKKSNGEYDLMLWREAGKNDTTGPRKISLTLNAMVSSATLFSDLANASPTQTNWSNRSTFTFDVSDAVVVLRLNKPQASQATQSLGVIDDFEGQTPGQSPTGWTNASGDTSWKIAAVGTNEFVKNTAASGDFYLSKTIASSGTAFTADFKYTWQYGGTASYGDYAQTVGVDVMDVAGNGYRVVLHQGTSGISTNAAKTVEIYEMNAGTVGTQLGSGTGFNQAGWDTLGYGAPNFHQIRLAYDNGTFTVYGDTNFNGTMDVLATGRSTVYTNFTRLKFRSLGSTGTSGPAFDDIQTNVPTVFVAASDGAAGENGDTGTFRVARSGGDLTKPLTVSYQLFGSATSGTDYAAIPLTVTFLANQAYADITVTPTADSTLTAEGDENVVLRLTEMPEYHVGTSGRTADVLFADYMPDLVVTGVIMSNPRPVDGETITYKVTVKNIGNAPVPLNRGWQAGILFDVQGQNSYLTPVVNTSLAAGASTTLDVTGSYTYVARMGRHQIMAWVDPALPNWNSTSGRVAESNDRNNAFTSMFNVATSRFTDPGTSLADWTTVDAGWTVKTTGAQTYFENTANTSGTRRLQRSLPNSTDHSWTLDFSHNWQWGGSSGTGQHSLAMSADVLDVNNNGFRVRFFQGSGGNAAYDGKLVQIFKVTGGLEAALPLDEGDGFDSPGWHSLDANGVPTWRRSRLMYDVGTRTLKVLIDVNGTFIEVASAADLNAPRTFTKLGFNAENLINAVAPELDDIQFDVLY